MVKITKVQRIKKKYQRVKNYKKEEALIKHSIIVMKNHLMIICKIQGNLVLKY